MLAWRIVGGTTHRVLYVGLDFYATRAVFVRHLADGPFLERGLVVGRKEGPWVRCCARCGGLSRDTEFARYCEDCVE
jgi:hypothetical protein